MLTPGERPPGGRRHGDTGCTCTTHLDRPWNRSEHWTAAEVAYLTGHFGSQADATIARRLGRSVIGIALKAKRLGLHKRDAGATARSVAAVFGVDPTTVGKHWIARGLLPARRLGKAYLHNKPGALQRGRPRRGGRYRRPAYWIVRWADVEAFINRHPECIDVPKMPASPYRDLAARDPWIGLPEVHRRTGRESDQVAWLIRKGVIRGRRRGTHWYMPEADLALVPPLASPEAIAESAWRRESVLAARRDVRKGLRRPPPRRATRRRPFTARLLTRAEFEARWAAEEEVA